MRDNYVKLIDFVIGKYMYTIMKNNDKVLYFEVVNDKYVQPIPSFNLYDNEGKSLTSVNEHFFMNQLINRINVAYKKGIFISDQEIVDFLNKVKSNLGDPELRKLFKGTYLDEINELNFENNKRSILRYLDNFKLDTFVDYNNVSVFNGSLEKNSTVLNNNGSEQVNNDVKDNTAQNLNSSSDMDVIDIIDVPTIESDIKQNSEVAIDFTNIPVDNSSGDVVSSSDYFSNSQTVQTNEQSLSNDVIQNDIQLSDSVASLDNNLNSEVNPTQESIVQSDVQSVQDDVSQQPVVQENPALQPATSSVDLTAPLDFNSLYSHNDSQPITQENVINNDSIQMVPNSDFSSSMLSTISNEADGITSDSQYVQPIENQYAQPIIDDDQTVNESFSNDGFSLAEPLVENAIDSNLNNNNVMYSEQVSAPSYISEVKDRLENNVFNTELGVMDSGVTEADLEKTVVVDRVNMPEIDSVSDEKPKKVKKKKSFGVVIFIIILLALLGAFAYFLYNYIF